MIMQSIRNGFAVQCYDSRTFRAEFEIRVAAGTLWSWYKELENAVDVLLFDDLGKFKGEGKRVEEEVFSVVKLRTEARRGMIITMNDPPEALAVHFSRGIAAPMIARLIETCTLIDFRTDQEKANPMMLEGLDL
jgi:DNA replication protein DnaC